jgi:hypothetical protein
MGSVASSCRYHPAICSGDEEYLFVSVSAANPYSIPDLYESAFSISTVRRAWLADLEWEHRGISGYSRELLKGSAGIILADGAVHAGAEAGLDSRSVEGYGRETSLSADCLLSMAAVPFVVVEVKASCYSDKLPMYGLLLLGGKESRFALMAGRGSRGETIARAGLIVRIASRLSILAGCDIMTGEISGGISIVSNRAAALSWSEHPVLGSTYSISLGILL